MTVLAASVQRECKDHVQQVNVVPINATSVVYAGSLVMREAATGVHVPGADTASCDFSGVALEELDNTSGADGTVSGTAIARAIRVDRVGEYAFAVDGATPKVGQTALIFDDNTVSADATSNSIACGKFTRPAPGGGWFVDIAR